MYIVKNQSRCFSPSIISNIWFEPIRKAKLTWRVAVGLQLKSETLEQIKGIIWKATKQRRSALSFYKCHFWFDGHMENENTRTFMDAPGQSPAPWSTSDGMDVVSVMGEGTVWSTAKETTKTSTAAGKGATCSVFSLWQTCPIWEKSQGCFLKE